MQRFQEILQQGEHEQVAFKNEPSGFVSELSYTNQKITTENVTEHVTEHVTENVTENRRIQIVTIIQDNPKITTTELAEVLQTTRRTIARDINILKEKGAIERIGGDKGGYWNVINL